jgi:tRNA-specific adenosine deaminase 2
MEPQSQMDPSTTESSMVANDAAKARRTYPSFGGLFAEEAIRLLQDFYIRGNPKAPKPHRALAPESLKRSLEGGA